MLSFVAGCGSGSFVLLCLYVDSARFSVRRICCPRAGRLYRAAVSVGQKMVVKMIRTLGAGVAIVVVLVTV